MKSIAGSGIILYLLMLVGLGVGWILNIVKLVEHINDPVTMMLILRGAGILVPPLGGVLGYL
jgi:hypothetical protein